MRIAQNASYQHSEWRCSTYMKREQSCKQVSPAQDWVLPALLTLISTSCTTTWQQLLQLPAISVNICSCEPAERDQGSKMRLYCLQPATPRFED